ncbi:MAG: SGNH/GDSL hydrolase family protein [Oscillospiraceae bacterium]|nr:SGNH/GDSL hydrolase family protein [Oscillospiraceae bacterium]
MELRGAKINFLGDSITEGVGASSPDKIYHACLARMAGLSEARNYGFSGTRFALQDKGIPEYGKGGILDENAFCVRWEMMSDDADAVIVFGGTNDYGHGDAPMGDMDDRTPETFYGACHYVFSKLIVKYLGKPIVIMTPLHRSDEVQTVAQKDSKKFGTLRDYVNVIREVAEYYSLPVLDLFAESGIQPAIPEIREKYMPDGCHPSDAGHEVVANKLKSFFERI